MLMICLESGQRLRGAVKTQRDTPLMLLYSEKLNSKM